MVIRNVSGNYKFLFNVQMNVFSYTIFIYYLITVTMRKATYLLTLVKKKKWLTLSWFGVESHQHFQRLSCAELLASLIPKHTRI